MHYLRPRLLRLVFTSKRTKVTVTHADAHSSCKRKQPTPIFLIGTSLSHEATEWQRRFSELGYQSTTALYSSEELESSKKDSLNTYYQDLVTIARDRCFFPPLLVGFDKGSWGLCRKFVANQPVSALAMIEQLHDRDQPNFWANEALSEFEPHFPILVISQQTTLPPSLTFLQDEIDHVVAQNDTKQPTLSALLAWIDEMNI
ncbi:uncharacterized protein BYT42DRAFT_18845 [Radiomyces spectabilis]|uniref:uncharacterized protein n=1 Tax=Radiomyces spectabilis TaxID=64574 RepID=UPI0022212079|nr:uncharacterized protein BYT42DRAFT_214187 [Radiomyces spectabilis]XP_051428324.1 uncharacterized protein BYT42DRAFT_18845 [Radiomyces spectabilis]KAI8364158.1 hypothetical protein BYT42DRAFT_214187 [Radiomyces spectabilis]KAI8393791.1 hypothetical protein BYT42DRAFT_18845 [Radiomyces spectabilis]